MRVLRMPVARPGVESVEIPGEGVFNFVNGEADFHDEIAQALIKAGHCKAMDIVKVQVPGDKPPPAAPASSAKP